jgi:molybdopterin molybdotransferase
MRPGVDGAAVRRDDIDRPRTGRVVTRLSRLEDALDRLLSEVGPLPAESVPLGAACGRVAGEEIRARTAVPHFARPAMDGYVCHDADVRDASPERPARLRVTGAVRMGERPGDGPARGEAWSITTGAPMPRRGDRVLPLETVRREGDEVRVGQPPDQKTHVAAPGEVIRGGDRLVAAGQVLRPPTVGALAACGIATLRVHRRPRVAVVATGDELVDAIEDASPLPPGRIFNSNAIMLAGLLGDAGCDVENHGIVRDAPEDMRAAFAALRERYDVVVSTGGVSVGRYDAVHRTWLDLGARRIVGRVDLKPGGPFFAGRLAGSWALGLSGTPVACLAAFHLLARPFFMRLAGRRATIRPVAEAALADGFPRATDRLRALWARVTAAPVGPPVAELRRDEAVGDLTSLLDANALVLLPPGTPPLPPGSRVSAVLLDRDEDRETLTVAPARPGPLVIGVVGESEGGKTTVIAGVVRRLAGEGFRIAAIKHTAHGFSLDRDGSDSARMAEAGAPIVALAGPTETVVRIAAPGDQPHRLASLAVAVAEQVWQMPPDLVLVEGFQHPAGPVIQVGPPKAGLAPGEVLATFPAVSGMNGDALERELGGVVEMIRSRVRGRTA